MVGSGYAFKGGGPGGARGELVAGCRQVGRGGARGRGSWGSGGALGGVAPWRGVLGARWVGARLGAGFLGRAGRGRSVARGSWGALGRGAPWYRVLGARRAWTFRGAGFLGRSGRRVPGSHGQLRGAVGACGDPAPATHARSRRELQVRQGPKSLAQGPPPIICGGRAGGSPPRGRLGRSPAWGAAFGVLRGGGLLSFGGAGRGGAGEPRFAL